MIYSITKLWRVQQWVKNIFVLIPLLFSKQFLNLHSIELALFAMLLFCVASSATYIVNDLLDIERDKLHPIKAHTRPLASGELGVATAVSVLLILYLVLIISSFLMPSTLAVIGFYLVLNLSYSTFLKTQPVFDVFIIAFGFVLRVYAGAVAINAGVSNWMFIVTLCLALYLACIKRRQELIKTGDAARSVLKSYTVPLLTQYSEMAASCTIIFYGLFIATVRPELILTIPFVLFGLYRYWYCVDANQFGESPTDVLLTDRVLQGTLLVWAGLSAWSLVYGVSE